MHNEEEICGGDGEGGGELMASSFLLSPNFAELHLNIVANRYTGRRSLDSDLSQVP